MSIIKTIMKQYGDSSWDPAKHHGMSREEIRNKRDFHMVQGRKKGLDPKEKKAHRKDEDHWRSHLTKPDNPHNEKPVDESSNAPPKKPKKRMPKRRTNRPNRPPSRLDWLDDSPWDFIPWDA